MVDGHCDFEVLQGLAVLMQILLPKPCLAERNLAGRKDANGSTELQDGVVYEAAVLSMLGDGFCIVWNWWRGERNTAVGALPCVPEKNGGNLDEVAPLVCFFERHVLP